MSLISTSALDKANIPYDWDELPAGSTVKGISSTPQTEKTFITKLTFLHEDNPLTITVALLVIESKDYRFLIGRDILCPLHYSLSDEGLSLTAPKTGESQLFPFSTASAFTISSSDMPIINTTGLVLKGDQKTILPSVQEAHAESFKQYSLEIISHCDLSEIFAETPAPNIDSIVPCDQDTKGEASSSFLNSSPCVKDTKGDCLECTWASDSPMDYWASHDWYGNPLPAVLR